MFDKELEQKLRESMEIPRDLGFDEGAWQGLEQQLDLLGAAAGGSLVGSGVKTALWTGKSWLSIAATVVFLGTTAFFLYQWKTAEQEFESLKVLTEQTEKLEPEISTTSLPPEAQATPELLEVNTQKQLSSHRNVHPRPTQPTAGNKKEKEAAENSAAGINLEKLAFLPTRFSPPLGDSLPTLEARRRSPAFESLTRVAHPIRIAVEASLVSMRAENLQPFKGQAIGLRGEYWLTQRMALQVGFRKERTEAAFAEKHVHFLKDRLPDPQGPFQRESKLEEASFSQEKIQVPLGLRYVLWQNHKVQILAGAAAVMEKTTRQEAWLTYKVRENRPPPFPPVDFVYSQRLRNNPQPIQIAQLEVELAARVQLKPQLAWELSTAFIQNPDNTSSLYSRTNGQKTSTSLIFSF